MTKPAKLPALRPDACPVCGQKGPGRVARTVAWTVTLLLLGASAAFVVWLLVALYEAL